MKRIIIQPEVFLKHENDYLEELRKKIAHDLKEDGVAYVPLGYKVTIIDSDDLETEV